MDSNEAPQELIRFLVKRLKECALESAAHRAVFFNFNDEARSLAESMFETYRQAEPIKQKVDAQFRDLERVIEGLGAELEAEEVRKLLERYGADGPIN
jgi:hypothetical protein